MQSVSGGQLLLATPAGPLPTTWPRLSRRAAFSALCAWCAVAALLVLGGRLGVAAPVLALLDNAAQLAAAAVATLACLRTTLRSRLRLRTAWAAMAMATGAWTAGQVAWVILESVRGDVTPFPSVADLGFLVFPVAATIAVATLPSGRARLRGRDVLDAFIIAMALTALTWASMAGASVRILTQPWLTATVSVAYPIGDTILVSVAVLAVSRAGRHRTALALIATAAALMMFSDVFFMYNTAIGSYVSGNACDLGWIGAFLVLAVAAVVHSGQQSACAAARLLPTGVQGVPDAVIGEDGADAEGGLFFLPYVPLVAAGSVAAWQWAIGSPTPSGANALLVGAVVLTLARQYLTLWDNRLLAAEVAARQADLHHQAFYDPLTGLANRALFTQRVTAMLELHRHDATPLAVLFCDLNDFKGVNDGLGHAAGDQLLSTVAQRLASTLRSGDTLARLGGDEFAVLVRAATLPRRAPGVGAGRSGPSDALDPVGARAIAERMQRALDPPIAVSDTTVVVGVSIGVACVGPDETTPSTDHLLSRADIAMYTAKRAATRRPVVYRSGLALPEASDWRLRPPLEQAIRNGDIAVHYQPIVELANGSLHGFEALARWKRGDQSVQPAVFLPVAARAGLMPALTDHMLRTASAQLVEWTARPGLGHLRMAVNVPPSQIIDPTFPDTVRAVIENYDVPVGGLVVEITEEALLTDLDTAVGVADKLRSLGVLLSLDDFGVGYSSLAHLHRLPLDKLKLDRAFVQNVDTDPELRRLLSGLLALSRDLGLTVVAEGIERSAQVRVLRDLGCTIGQGFLFAPAAAPTACERLFAGRMDTGGMDPSGRRARLIAARSA